jgi:hypothetical protein
MYFDRGVKPGANEFTGMFRVESTDLGRDTLIITRDKYRNLPAEMKVVREVGIVDNTGDIMIGVGLSDVMPGRIYRGHVLRGKIINLQECHRTWLEADDARCDSKQYGEHF